MKILPPCSYLSLVSHTHNSHHQDCPTSHGILLQLILHINIDSFCYKCDKLSVIPYKIHYRNVLYMTIMRIPMLTKKPFGCFAIQYVKITLHMFQ